MSSPEGNRQPQSPSTS
uniref:Atg10 n=1 Tax=Arundo donax TaxID=35708 RepID=A0A0A9FWX8_ARUDO